MIHQKHNFLPKENTSTHGFKVQKQENLVKVQDLTAIIAAKVYIKFNQLLDLEITECQASLDTT